VGFFCVPAPAGSCRCVASRLASEAAAASCRCRRARRSGPGKRGPGEFGATAWGGKLRAPVFLRTPGLRPRLGSAAAILMASGPAVAPALRVGNWGPDSPSEKKGVSPACRRGRRRTRPGGWPSLAATGKASPRGAFQS
jgi:hypothetical protein